LCKSEAPFIGNTTNLWFHLLRGDQLHKQEFAAIESLKQTSTKRKRTSSRPNRLLDRDEEANVDDIEMDPNSSTGSSSNANALI
jgi:hypothetical protein